MLKGIEKQNRDQFSQGMDVLQVLSDHPRMKTHTMYAANLTWKNMEELLTKLIRPGWIIEIHQPGKRTLVKITPDGSEVLKAYKNIRGKFEGVTE